MDKKTMEQSICKVAVYDSMLFELMQRGTKRRDVIAFFHKRVEPMELNPVPYAIVKNQEAINGFFEAYVDKRITRRTFIRLATPFLSDIVQAVQGLTDNGLTEPFIQSNYSKFNNRVDNKIIDVIQRCS